MAENYITDPYRTPILALELLVVFIFLEIAIFFLSRYRHNRKEKIPSFVELDWAIIFSCFSLAYLFYIMGAFFGGTLEVDRANFIFGGYLSLVIGGLLFIYHLELTRTIYTGYKITLFTLGILIMFFILFFVVDTSIFQSVGNISSIFAFSIILIYFMKVIRRIWAFYRLHSLGLFLGITLWLTGYALTTDLAINQVSPGDVILPGDFIIRLIGDVVILGGMLLVAFFVNTLPSLDEIGWRDKVKYIMLTTQTGISIYSESFQERAPIQEVLMSGGIWGIDVFLQNVLKDADLKVIERGTDVILIEKGNYITAIMVVEQDLKLLRYLLFKLVIQFEFYYARVLMDWGGDTSLFNPTKNLISTIFEYEKI